MPVEGALRGTSSRGAEMPTLPICILIPIACDKASLEDWNVAATRQPELHSQATALQTNKVENNRHKTTHLQWKGPIGT